MSPTGWRVAFVGALLLQSVVLYWPRPPGVASGLPLDKGIHFAIFAAVAAVGVRAGLRLALVGAMLGLQAIASEVLQSFIPGRGGDPGDLLADVLGIVAGLLIGLRWTQRAHRQEPDAPPGIRR